MSAEPMVARVRRPVLAAAIAAGAIPREYTDLSYH